MNEFENNLNKVIEAKKAFIDAVNAMEAARNEKGVEASVDKDMFRHMMRDDFGADIRKALDKLAALELRNRYDY